MWCHWILSVSVITLTWLLHSLKRGPLITRHDCSTVTNLTMLLLQGAGIYTWTDTVFLHFSENYLQIMHTLHDGKPFSKP